MAKEESVPRYSSVENYLTTFDEIKAHTMRAVIAFILQEFPELEVKIAWNVPQIHRDGKYVAGIDAFKNHITFSAWSPRIIAEFKEERLLGYVVKMNCFQVPVDWTLDEKLIKDLIRARLVELDKGIA